MKVRCLALLPAIIGTKPMLEEDKLPPAGVHHVRSMTQPGDRDTAPLSSIYLRHAVDRHPVNIHLIFPVASQKMLGDVCRQDVLQQNSVEVLHGFDLLTFPLKLVPPQEVQPTVIFVLLQEDTVERHLRHSHATAEKHKFWYLMWELIRAAKTERISRETQPRVCLVCTERKMTLKQCCNVSLWSLRKILLRWTDLHRRQQPLLGYSCQRVSGLICGDKTSYDCVSSEQTSSFWIFLHMT